MKKIKFLLVFLPLLTGVLIYLLYRSRNLFYFNIVDFLNIRGYVLLAREIAWLYRKLFPTWVIYSLPDGLWLFSTGAIFLLCRRKFIFHFIWFSFIFLGVIGLEYVQKLYGGHGTPIGTYDKSDIVAFTYGYIAVCIVGVFLRVLDNKYKYRYTLAQEIFQNIRYTIVFSIIGVLANML